MLIATMNRCLRGSLWDIGKKNVFTIRKYQDRISGPMMDRIDIYAEVTALNDDSESLPIIRERVVRAR